MQLVVNIILANIEPVETVDKLEQPLTVSAYQRCMKFPSYIFPIKEQWTDVDIQNGVHMQQPGLSRPIFKNIGFRFFRFF